MELAPEQSTNQGIDLDDNKPKAKVQQQQSSKTSKDTNKEAATTGNTNSNSIPLGMFDAKEASQLIELRNASKLVFESNNDPEDEVLKKYLGNPIFDDVNERRNKKPYKGTLLLYFHLC